MNPAPGFGGSVVSSDSELGVCLAPHKMAGERGRGAYLIASILMVKALAYCLRDV